MFTGFYNQLKQEFASARWLYFEGTHDSGKHFSDGDMLLYDTLDATVLGLGVEKIKLAFRMSYSLLDKIAYFLNRYLNLGIPATRVSFRTIWREKDAKSQIRREFHESKNWPLRGLFWLSKDLFEEGYMDMAEPDSRELAQLRNHLEHKYVKVQSELLPFFTGLSGPYFDDFAYSISRSQLESGSLQILKLARSARMYLSLAMHREETRRTELKPDAVFLPVHLPPLAS